MNEVLLNSLQKFWRNEDGAFLAIFGVIAIVLVALSGAVVDYVTVQQARNRAQTALDAAVLSLQPSIYTLTDAELTSKAQALLTQQIADSHIGATIVDVQTDETEGTLYFEARLTVPMIFVSLVGVNEMQPLVASQATRKKIFLEVAFVLDNSGSMASSSRMTNLKAAAKSAVDILYDYKDPATGGDGSVSDQTLIGIVPFNFHVNVGTANKTASWMDGSGNSEIANDNFDNDDKSSTAFTGAVDRFALYDQISNVSWAGCVEARKYPYDTDDTEPDASVPNTLFIPVFAPDEPDPNSYTNNYLNDDPAACNYTGTCQRLTYQNGCNSSYSNCNSPSYTWTAVFSDGASVSASGSSSSSSVCSCSSFTTDSGWSYGGPSWNRWKQKTQTCAAGNLKRGSLLSNRERQERICKYTGSTASINTGSSRFGPNGGCISTPILPLTNTRANVISRINAMTSDGATNIHMGAEWGFHMLSPTEPLTEGRGYDTAVSKVAIIMTDGENTFYQNSNDSSDLNGAWYYPAYGNPYNQRLGDMTKSTSQIEGLMDDRVLETCANMKAAGIDVYTIGLEPPNTDVETMLTSCASSPSKAYFPASSSELTAVFEDIANELADLRLAL